MRNLPSEYQEVEWIESSGTQYIDTGYVPSANYLKFEWKFQKYVNFGVSNVSTSQRYNMAGYSENNILEIYFGTSSSYNLNFSTNTTDIYECSCEANNGVATATVNGVITNVSYSGTLQSAGAYSFPLFARRESSYHYSSGKLYYAKLYSSQDTLVRDLVPCYLKNGGTIGLYDLVNNVFYTNQGSGTFSKGADVLPPQRYTSKLYLNGSEFFFDEGVPSYLCFTANTAGSTVTLGKTGSPSIANTAYSTDGVNWTSYTPGSTGAITLTNVGDKVYFRNDITRNFSTSNYLQFSMTGSISASGNCNSMYSATGFETLTTLSYTFCYYSMFYGCTSLTTVPELPATTLSDYCYSHMFNGCTSLTTAPELPATTLSNYCYYAMFSGCTSLTTAPELPATTLSYTFCYYSMFRGCTSLTTVPELPATTLSDYCYSHMFNGCTSLTTAPELPATTLSSYCYISMFSGCTSLTTVPELPATTLTKYCYESMFKGCSNIKLSTTQTGEYQTPYRIPTSGTGSATSTSLSSMFSNTGGTFTGTPSINTTYYTSNTVV